MRQRRGRIRNSRGYADCVRPVVAFVASILWPFDAKFGATTCRSEYREKNKQKLGNHSGVRPFPTRFQLFSIMSVLLLLLLLLLLWFVRVWLFFFLIEKGNGGSWRSLTKTNVVKLGRNTALIGSLVELNDN